MFKQCVVFWQSLSSTATQWHKWILGFDGYLHSWHLISELMIMMIMYNEFVLINVSMLLYHIHVEK